MASLNKVFLMGNMTRDPELRYTPGGAAVTDLPIAVNRSWTGKDGERKEEVLFIDVVVWDRQAETCCQYLTKGRGVHVEGSLKMETWDDKTTGEKKTKIKVLADRVQFLDRREGGGPAPGGGGEEFAPSPSRDRDRDREAAPARRAPSGGGAPGAGRAGGFNGGAPPRRPAPAPPPVDADGDREDEDIPF